jgi:hypothetical protein
MKTKPMLDNWEIDHIESVEIVERREFAEHDIIGKQGNAFQDLGARPARIMISGSVWGDEAREKFFTSVRDKYNAGAPVTFVADIVTATSVQYVIIESLRFYENSGRPGEIRYSMVLSESPPPPPPPNPFGALDTGLLDQAASFMDSVTGALDALAMLGNLPDLSNPAPALGKSLDGVKDATAGSDGIASPLSGILG